MTNQEQPEPQPEEKKEPHTDLDAARELFERTKAFLGKCAQDPRQGLASDDPRELIDELRNLSRPSPIDAADEEPPPSIQRRRSA